MATDLSRRGLFRAFRAGGQQDAAAPLEQIARITMACVEPKGVTCRRCGDECDLRAITFVPLGQGRAHVAVDASLCSGCGACLPVCPTAGIELIAADRAALLAGLVDMENGQ